MSTELLKWNESGPSFYVSEDGKYLINGQRERGVFDVYAGWDKSPCILIASPTTIADAKQAAQYHFDLLQQAFPATVTTAYVAPVIDCDYHYFKTSGKWYASGEGRFPKGNLWKIDRNMIVAENGSMPGLSSRAEEFTIVVVPRGNCQSQYACPIMIQPGAY